MIKIKVAELMGKYKMKQKDLARLTGLYPVTVAGLYHERINQIGFETLEKLCKAFDCQVGDILEYVPDDAGGES